jgi:hypothetical protein
MNMYKTGASHFTLLYSCTKLQRQNLPKCCCQHGHNQSLLRTSESCGVIETPWGHVLRGQDTYIYILNTVYKFLLFNIVLPIRPIFAKSELFWCPKLTLFLFHQTLPAMIDFYSAGSAHRQWPQCGTDPKSEIYRTISIPGYKVATGCTVYCMEQKCPEEWQQHLTLIPHQGD